MDSVLGPKSTTTALIAFGSAITGWVRLGSPDAESAVSAVAVCAFAAIGVSASTRRFSCCWPVAVRSAWLCTGRLGSTTWIWLVIAARWTRQMTLYVPGCMLFERGTL